MPMFMPMRSRIGPLTTITGVAPHVVDMMPCALNSGVATASSAARTTGRYSGLHPAMTALAAIFSIVAGPMFGGSAAMTSRGSRLVPVSMRFTRSGVGGITGRPSVRPRSNINSNSSWSPISICRAVSFSPRASASIRSAISGSTDLEPHPGRCCGYFDQSMDGVRECDNCAISAIISCQSVLSKPTKRRISLPSGAARMMVGTVSRS